MMLRKAVAGVVIGLSFCAVPVSAQNIKLSAGGGAFFASDFGGQGTTFKYVQGITSTTYDGVILDDVFEITNTTPWLGGGIYGFLDATYAEAGLGLTFAGGNPHRHIIGRGLDTTISNKDSDISLTFLNIGVLGKYPVPLNSGMTVFPAAGFEYAVCIAGQNKTPAETIKFDGKKETIRLSDGTTSTRQNPYAIERSQLWIRFGGGLDYKLANRMFLRAQALYGIGFAGIVYSASVINGRGGSNVDEASTTLSHGLTVKAGVGFEL